MFGKFISSILLSLSLLFLLTVQVSAAGPVIWRTNHASLEADFMAIEVNGRTFSGNDSVYLSSDPGSDGYTTFEATWYENGTEMRLFIYFSQENGKWKATEMRTYNGGSYPDWIYYEGFDGSNVGDYLSEISKTFTSKDGTGKVTFKNLRLGAFLPKSKPSMSPSGYTLETVMSAETVIVTTNPLAGYGVNVILKDNSNKVVADQSGITYVWSADKPELASVVAGPLCAYGINPPCPMINGQIQGLRLGQTKIIITALMEGKEIASTSFPVAVVKEGSTNVNEKKLEDISREIQDIRQSVQDVKNEQSWIRGVLENILNILRNIFGYNKN